MSSLSNILNVARREFTVRARTRSFRIGTAVLIVGVIALAFVPTIGRYLDRGATERIGLRVAVTGLTVDPAATLGSLLNATTSTPDSGSSSETTYQVVPVADLDAARGDVVAGRMAAILAMERDPGGDLRFSFYAKDPTGIGASRTSALLHQAANALAIADRLDRLGVAPADRAGLLAPAGFDILRADPTDARPAVNGTDEATSYLLGFGMTILIFLMVVLYGNWVAMSVVEEKSSRVMEVILNAATPFQLLTGKVLGVGAVALVQYVAIIVAGGLAIIAQGPVSDLVLGTTSGGSGLPRGLTGVMLALLGVYGVLGFLLYAVLYAAAGSLVSRQEDVNQAVMPMTLVSSLGYIVAVYAATGLLDLGSNTIAILSQIPFFSPFMMLSRVTAGEVEIWEILLSMALLALAIAAALWLAARIYAAGVLLYGQRPGVRSVWRLVRAGG
jgi:ABC-2 type transport system permease protein